MPSKNFVVYRSSAGAGKTYTLVKEYLKLALGTESPKRFRSILAVTFTNKAAAEMKERVITQLNGLSLTPTDPSFSELHDSALCGELMQSTGLTAQQLQERANNVLEHMLHNYAELSICTIDKFVHRIIRSFARDLNIAPDFEVELEQEELLSKAIDLLIGKVGDNDVLTKTLVEFTEGKADKDNDLLTYAKKLLNEDSEPFLDALKKTPMEAFFGIRNQMVGEIDAFEAHLAGLGQKAVHIMEKHHADPSIFFGKSRGLPKFFSSLAALENFEPSSNARKTVEEDKWFAGTPDADAVRVMALIKAPLTDIYNSVITHLDEHLKRYQIQKLVNEHLYAASVLSELDKVVNQLKTDNNILLISDFNRYISEIVREEPAPFIYERVGERYQNFLIDEFQDTSVLQWQNLLPLVENSLSTGNFNLVVGDGKQAIYRWRSGEVEQFAKLPELFKGTPIQQDAARMLALNYQEEVLGTNWRSSADVIDFNNNFFTALASQELTDSYAGIYENLKQASRKEKGSGYVEVEVLEVIGDAKEMKQLYFASTLEKIRKCVDDDNFQLRDIAILVRSNSQGSEISSFLIDEGIDVVSTESLLVTRSPEVRFIIDCFKHARDQKDNTPKAAIVRYLSQHIKTDKTFNELVDFYSLKREDKRRSPIILLNDFLDGFGYQMRLSRLVQQPIYQSAEDLIRVFKLNERSPAYLQFFLDAVHSYSARYGNNTVEFLEWWEAKQHKFSVKVPEGKNAVRVMTIHKSKGLEFPVVIMPFADWQLKNTNDELWVDLDDEVEGLASGLVTNKKELEGTNYAELYRDERNKTMLDHINILYVAFTRAENRLYVLTKDRGKSRTSKAFICDLIVNQVETMEGWNEGMGALQLGFDTPYDAPEKASEGTYLLDHLSCYSWSEKLRISMQAPTMWDFDNFGAAKQNGALVLNALSRLEDSSQLGGVCSAMHQEGLVTKDEQAEMLENLQTLLSKPEIAPWFAPGVSVKINQEILAENGATLKPNRIIFQNGSATVLEFKTGVPADKDPKALKATLPVLKQMGYEATAFLVYTESGEVKAV
jgi:ATP-dependent helicase/nuclease subunit A